MRIALCSVADGYTVVVRDKEDNFKVKKLHVSHERGMIIVDEWKSGSDKIIKYDNNGVEEFYNIKDIVHVKTHVSSKRIPEGEINKHRIIKIRGYINQ